MVPDAYSQNWTRPDSRILALSLPWPVLNQPGARKGGGGDSLLSPTGKYKGNRQGVAHSEMFKFFLRLREPKVVKRLGFHSPNPFSERMHLKYEINKPGIGK